MTTLKEAMKKSKETGKRVKVTQSTPITETKINVSIRIDSLVLTWLKGQAELKGLPYQTLINSILTQEMKSGGLEERLSRLEKILKEKSA